MKTSPKLKRIYHLLFSHFGPQNWWPGDTDFEICLGAILTQNTNWQNVEKAINNLKAERLLKPGPLYDLPLKKLARLIKPSGYFNIKAQRLRNFLEFLVTENRGSLKRVFSGDMEKARKRLLEVKGIGPETADSMLLYAGGFPVFVIDAYTKRAFSRIGLCAKDVDYHDLQKFFMKNLPPDTGFYNEYHALIVMLGKNYCKPKPVCSACPLNKICEAGQANIAD